MKYRGKFLDDALRSRASQLDRLLLIAPRALRLISVYLHLPTALNRRSSPVSQRQGDLVSPDSLLASVDVVVVPEDPVASASITISV